MSTVQSVVMFHCTGTYNSPPITEEARNIPGSALTHNIELAPLNTAKMCFQEQMNFKNNKILVICSLLFHLIFVQFIHIPPVLDFG